MGFNITFENDDSLQLYLTEMEKDAEKTEKQILGEAGDELKKYVEENLNMHRRTLEKRYKVAMADDVKKSTKTNKYGEKYVSVHGGKKTGTLWHLVNDGTLHTFGIHFMNGALARLDGTMDKLWDRILRWLND